MNNLDLNAIGVQEMKRREIQTVDGGIYQLLLGAAIGWAFSQDWEKMGDAWQDGWNAAGN